ncbi:MAG: rhodanese-like domain-containing protein [Candidatus Campbellbacteria bacterium]|nr:rhodanese-like domain-containing protein [Candidatus Campbellbacteria bacterium]
MNKQKILLVLVALVVGVVGGFGGAYMFESLGDKNQNKLIKDYYLVENAVGVSPHGLRLRMDKGDQTFILVDLRSQEEYEREHITGAINIPAYSDKFTSAYHEVERIVGSFRELPEDKEIITYCYSVPCMTSRRIGKLLVENDIYVKHLNIGWNEWRYFWNLWNVEHELADTSPEQYVTEGPEPGVLENANPFLIDTGCTAGEFGC